jgi:hypothetical protein
MKFCSGECKRLLHESNFHSNAAQPDGLHSTCKECRSKRRPAVEKAWRERRKREAGETYDIGYDDMPEQRTMPVEQGFSLLPLFVIKQIGREMYWTCSSEHGSGWQEGDPKQAFTKSELSKEVYRLIDKGWWVDCEIKQLGIR